MRRGAWLLLVPALGDRRFVQSVVFGPPPPITHQHTGYFGPGRHPPRNALWAYIGATKSESFVGSWEVALVRGALRDELCAASGRLLVGRSIAGHVGGVSDGGFALGQRFPNPPPSVYRSRVAAVAKRFGFRVVSLRLLRPLQLAPALVVETDRNRKSFVADVPSIVGWLDPRNGEATTFEGFLFEARDEKGPFVRVENVYRGEVEGGQWSADPCDYPFPHPSALTLHGNPC